VDGGIRFEVNPHRRAARNEASVCSTKIASPSCSIFEQPRSVETYVHPIPSPCHPQVVDNGLEQSSPGLGRDWTCRNVHAARRHSRNHATLSSGDTLAKTGRCLNPSSCCSCACVYRAATGLPSWHCHRRRIHGVGAGPQVDGSRHREHRRRERGEELAALMKWRGRE
jgi:hypothetical protein